MTRLVDPRTSNDSHLPMLLGRLQAQPTTVVVDLVTAGQLCSVLPILALYLHRPRNHHVHRALTHSLLMPAALLKPQHILSILVVENVAFPVDAIAQLRETAAAARFESAHMDPLLLRVSRLDVG